MVERTTSTSKWTDHEICTTMHIKNVPDRTALRPFYLLHTWMEFKRASSFLVLLEMHQAYIPMFDAFCSLNGE